MIRKKPLKQYITVPIAPGESASGTAFISNMKDVDGNGQLDIFCRQQVK